MEATTCSSCGRQMSLKDLANNSFREVNGELHCPECLLKLGHPRKMRCPNCGKETTAVLHQGKYACTHCGHQMGGRQEKGVIASAKPATSREAAQKKPKATPITVPRRRKNRAVPILAVLASSLAALALIFGALLIRAGSGRNAGRAPAPAPKNQLTDDEKILLGVREWQKQRPTDHAGAIKMYRAAIAHMQSPILKMEAEKTVVDLEDKLAKAERAPAAGRQEQDELARKPAAARQEIERLKTPPAPRTPAQKPDAPPPKPRDPVPEPKPEPAVTPPKPKTPETFEPEDEAKTAYLAAMAEAGKLIGRRQYGAAMAALKAVTDKHGDTEWGAAAETERKRIRGDAYQEFNKLSERAEVLRRAGDGSGARELYATARMFGVREIDEIIHQKLAMIRREEEAGPAAAKPRELSAAVKEQIGVLSSGAAHERSDAALRLGDLGDRDAVPYLAAALKDKNWSVRSRAAISLNKLGDASAVPALIEALDDEAEPVNYDVHEALKALTKQGFARDEKAKWRAWHRNTTAAETNEAPVRPLPAGASQFAATILVRKYDPAIVSFLVPKEITLGVGTKVGVFRGASRVCDVLVQQITEGGQAFGAIEGLAAGSKLGPGDKVAIHLPK
ncbi:MAG: HEAT repeat domain-containing protein [Planctomycetota bacterium]